jgi:hypothetical protein
MSPPLVEALKVELEFAAEEVPSDDKNKDKEALEKKARRSRPTTPSCGMRTPPCRLH